MNGQQKRKIYFINKDLQGKFIFNYFILLTLGSILFVGIFSFFSSNTLSIVYENYHLHLGTTPGILFKKILSTQWLFIVIGGVLICFITLRLTHRIAGPFYRFERALDEMIGGDISRTVVLREKDAGKDLAEKINAFNSRLSENLFFIEELNSKIAISSRQIENELGEDDREKFAQLLETIRESQKNIEVTVNEYSFNTSPRL
ncbi:methyl-accepting chemotaxis protein [Desulfospira joergensenii]|uniref:methyl-accepting chemotaxis protein n=1 Tax=Desulfospira joergensenii TaxID=53329 RepID=UPI0003B7274A|nr:methyl-accepting chemotaxis protein [Desulfospira joergensenii]